MGKKITNPLIGLIFLLAFSLSVLKVMSVNNGYNAVDFYHFWLVPKIVHQHNENEIYKPKNQIYFGKIFADQFSPNTYPQDYTFDEEKYPPYIDVEELSSSKHFNYFDPFDSDLTIKKKLGRFRWFLDLTSTPITYTVMSVFSGKDLITSYRLYQFFIIILFLVSLLLLAKTMQIAASVVFPIFIVFLWSFFPLITEIVVANITVLQFFLCFSIFVFYIK